MKTLLLALGFVAALAPSAPTGRPADTPGNAADTVTVTLVRWPFT